MAGLTLSADVHVDPSTRISAKALGRDERGGPPYAVLTLRDPDSINRGIRIYVDDPADLTRLETAVAEVRETLVRLQLEAVSTPVLPAPVEAVRAA